jgi:hypothetical protein
MRCINWMQLSLNVTSISCLLINNDLLQYTNKVHSCHHITNLYLGGPGEKGIPGLDAKRGRDGMPGLPGLKGEVGESRPGPNGMPGMVVCQFVEFYFCAKAGRL